MSVLSFKSNFTLQGMACSQIECLAFLHQRFAMRGYFSGFKTVPSLHNMQGAVMSLIDIC